MVTKTLTGHPLYKQQPLAEYVSQHAKIAPNSPAIYYYDSEFSYAWLDLVSDNIAAYLFSKGVRKGDVVAAYMQNTPQFVAAYIGTQKLGATYSPCNPMLKSKELDYQLRDLNARALILSAELLAEYEAAEYCAEAVLVTSYHDVLEAKTHNSNYSFKIPVEPAVAQFDTWANEIGFTEPGLNRPEITTEFEPRYSKPEIDRLLDPALIIYTSGTSGLPKGAMLSFANCEFKSVCVAANYEYTSEDRVSAVMPIFHVAGMLVGMTAPLIVGAAMIIFTRFDGNDFVDQAVRRKMTFSYTTPPINRGIIDTGRAAEISTLRQSIGTSFGSQITAELSAEWESYTGQKFYEFAYGMSETHTADSMTVPGAIKWGSAGQPTFDTEIWITDPNDRNKRLPSGELGEISVKSPAVFLGYKGKPEATAAALVDGRYYSGDMGRLTSDGYLYFDGRYKEMIKCNGYSVFPEEVEKYLQTHPAVKQAVAIGVPDEVRGESVRAFIVPNPEFKNSITEAEIISWARENMAAYKYPRSVRFIEQVPQTPTGKMLRAKLKDIE